MQNNAQQPTVKLELSINHINVVLGSLAKLPLETVLETFTEIQRQANAQLGPPKGPLSDKVMEH